MNEEDRSRLEEFRQFRKEVPPFHAERNLYPGMKVEMVKPPQRIVAGTQTVSRKGDS
jgi:hypothetical protein